MSVLLSAYQLKKSFGAKTLFADLTFSIEDRQKIGLIGPNGAGKSTLLKILSGKVTPDSGKVSRSSSLRIGYLEQEPQFNLEQDIQEAILDVLDAHDPDVLSKCQELISKLDLDSEKISVHAKIKSLSEGWKKRVALARELLKSPDLLILDEPTNHLDVHSILWLEEFINSQRSLACLIVTHDRLFLQNVCDHIFDLDPRLPEGLLKTTGSYDRHLEAKTQLLDAQRRLEDVRRNTLRREIEWLRRGPQARLTKQKARIDRAHGLIDEVDYLEDKNRSRAVEIDFGNPERTPKKLIEAMNISLSRSDKLLFKDFSYLIGARTRIGLLGTNGCGKSSLILTLLGKISPDSGKVEHHNKLKVAFFEQKKESMNLDKTVLQFICPDGDYVHFQGQAVFARSYLHRFHFSPDQMDLKIRHLSGGEKSRLFIAQLMLAEASLLVLDEPTNDLDLETLDVLSECLKTFAGAVILVSHNRHFMDDVVDEIIAFTENDGEILRFANYFQWESWNRERQKLNAAKVKTAQASTSNSDTKSKKGKLSFKEQYEFDRIEDLITKEEELLADLQKQFSSSEIQSNYQKLSELGNLISTQEKKIEDLYSRWQILTEKLQGG